MSLNISEYPISQSIARPVQTLQNSNVYQTNINYGATERFINNTELSQSINLLNNGEITSPTEDINLNYVSNTDNINLGTNQINSEINYYNQSINNYETGEVTSSQNQINNTYATPTLSQIKVLPTKYLPVKVIQSDQQLNELNVTNYAQVVPLSSYNNTENNVNIISNTTNTVEQTNTYYNTTTTTTTATPITNISYTNEVYNTNNYENLNSYPENIPPVSQTNDINYTTEEYQINNYETPKETENINYEITQNEGNIDNNYLLNEIVDSNQNVDINTNNEIYQVDNNENKEYLINADENQDIYQENYDAHYDAHSYNQQSPLIKKKIDIFSEIQSPLSKYETQSYNQENTIFRLENEINNLKAENETFKQKLGELDRYKSEAAEARALKEQVEQLSPLREQLEEMASLKAQLAELDELKMKVKELESLRAQMEQGNSKKKKKFKSLGKKVVKSSIKTTTKEVVKKTNIESKNESAEKNTNINANANINTNITFGEKTEQAFVNGDIIHSIDELEMLVRKINKSSQKMTLNLIYKATADSDRAEEFHKKCDKAKSSLVLIETDKGKRFGGYTSTNWEGKCIDKLDEEAFVFSLDKMKTYENIKGEKAIGCYPKFGPVFLGCQIRIYDNAFQRGGTTYEKGLNFNTKEDFELTGGDREFKVKDIEVYEIIAQ